MQLDQFQARVEQFRSSAHNLEGDSNLTILYPILGLTDKAGNIANVLRKSLTNNGGVISFEEISKVGEELADLLWYVAALSQDIGYPLSQIARISLEKQEAKHG